MDSSQGPSTRPEGSDEEKSSKSPLDIGEWDDSALWRAVSRRRSDAIGELARRNERVARNVAWSMKGRGLDDATLLAEAKQALHHAILECDPARHLKFPAFAFSYVKKKLVDLVRDLDPRTVHERRKAAQFCRMREVLAHEIQSNPTDDL